MPPRFQHYPQLPQLHEQGLQMTVLAGEWLGQQAPTEVHSPLVAVDMEAEQATSATVVLRPDFEYAVLCLYGDLQVNGEPAPGNELVYLPDGHTTVQLQCGAGSRCILLGGTPYEGGVLIWWNFVGQSQQEIEGFLHDWQRGEGFGAPLASPLPPLVAPSLKGVHLRSPGEAPAAD